MQLALGVCVDFREMTNIKVVHVDDMDCVVEPGITWNALNDELKKYNLFYPVDPGPGASIGGMVSDGDGDGDDGGAVMV